jgi:hypothetical protein
MCICSLATHWFSQQPLLALPIILPHADVITVVVIRDYGRGYVNFWLRYSVFKIFHPSIPYVSQDKIPIVELKWKRILTLRQKNGEM